MRFRVGSEEIPVTSIKVKESFNMVFSVVEITSPIAVSGEVVMITTEKEYKMFVFSLSQSEGRLCKIKMMPSVVRDLNNKVLPKFQGEATVSQLLGNYGIKVALEKETPSQYWEIPELKFLEFFKEIQYSLNTGSAPVSTLTVGGAYLVIDLKSKFEKDSEAVVAGDLIEQNSDLEKTLALPGTLTIYQDTIEGQEKIEIVVGSSPLGKAITKKLVTNEKLTFLEELRSRNMMGVGLYKANSFKIKTNVAPTTVLGTTLSYGNVKGVLTEVEFGETEYYLTLSAPAW